MIRFPVVCSTKVFSISPNCEFSHIQWQSTGNQFDTSIKLIGKGEERHFETYNKKTVFIKFYFSLSRRLRKTIFICEQIDRKSFVSDGKKWNCSRLLAAPMWHFDSSLLRQRLLPSILLPELERRMNYEMKGKIFWWNSCFSRFS
jgi:hypothetical protein